MYRIIGAGLVAAGVVVNNYAFLRWGSSSVAQDVIVLGSGRMAVAATGVLLVAAGLLVLLRWARTSSGHPQHP